MSRTLKKLLDRHDYLVGDNFKILKGREIDVTVALACSDSSMLQIMMEELDKLEMKMDAKFEALRK